MCDLYCDRNVLKFGLYVTLYRDLNRIKFNYVPHFGIEEPIATVVMKSFDMTVKHM